MKNKKNLLSLIFFILCSCADIERNPLAIRTHEYGSFEHRQVGLGSFSETCEILYEKKIIHGLFVLPLNPLTKEEIPSLKNKKIRIKYLIRKMDFLYNLLGFVFSIITQTLVIEECGKVNLKADIAEQKLDDLLQWFLNKYPAINTMRAEKKLDVKIINGRMIIMLSSDVIFESGTTDLSQMGKNTIQELTIVLSQVPGKRFQVEGHTDNDQNGISNWELAANRALSVVNAMVKSGTSEIRIFAVSFGDSKPIVPNDSSKNKVINRRIEIVILPTYDFLSGYE